MISFLIAIDQIGLIKKIHWSEPVFIVNYTNQPFSDLFVNMEKSFLLQVVEQSQLEEWFHENLPLQLSNYPARIDIISVKGKETSLILGIEHEDNQWDGVNLEYEKLIRRFMQVIKESDSETEGLNTEMTRLQFEKIQVLNNELINTRRQLEKTMAQTNRLNQDLNNRLVKDPLTGLLSRYQYRTEIEQVIVEHPGKQGIFAFIDIDDFKKVNDQYGHAAGDRYLIEFSNRLNNIKNDRLLKMRIAGDEFGLFFYGLNQREGHNFERCWQQIKSALLFEPIVVNNRPLPLTISAGMAVYGSDTKQIYELIEYADVAMYQAKKAGKNQYRSYAEKSSRDGLNTI